MTAAEHLGLVPDPDYCVILREQGFPQDTKFFWATSGLVNLKQEDIWVLLSRDELDANNLVPGEGQCFAAPVSEEFMRYTPLQYFVTFARFGYIFVDIMRTKVDKQEVPLPANAVPNLPNEIKPGQPIEAPKHINMGVAFFRIKEADAQTAANCWAKGFCYLLLKKYMSFNVKAKTS